MAISLKILKYDSTATAEIGTDTDTIVISNHGLEVGCHIVNTTRNTLLFPASRMVTQINSVNSFELNRYIGSQTNGDSIRLYKFVDYTSSLKTQSLSIETTVQRRNSCSFQLILDSASDIPTVGQYILIKNGSTTVFGGAIKTIRKKRLGKPSNYKLQCTVTVEGYNHIPAKRTITVDYPTGGKSGNIVKDMISLYLSAEGISEGTINDGYTWDEYPLDELGDCMSVKDVLDDMANQSGFYWYIDFNRQLHFKQDESGGAAAHALVDGNGYTDYDIEGLEETLINYRNKQFVKGATDDFGESIVLFRENTSQIEERQNIEGTSGVYGSIYEDADKIDNTTQKTAESGTTTTNVKITAHGLVTGDMIFNVTRNAKRRVTRVDADNVTVDTVSAQTTGDTIVYYPDADNIAENLLKRYGSKVPQEVSFETMSLDYVVGTKLEVQLAVFGMSASEYYLIESVELFDDDGVNLRARVTATRRDGTDFSTQHTEDWVDAFASFATKGELGTKTAPLSSSGIWVGTQTQADAKTNWKQDDFLFTSDGTLTLDAARPTDFVNPSGTIYSDLPENLVDTDVNTATAVAEHMNDMNTRINELLSICSMLLDIQIGSELNATNSLLNQMRTALTSIKGW